MSLSVFRTFIMPEVTPKILMALPFSVRDYITLHSFYLDAKMFSVMRYACAVEELPDQN